MQPVSATDAIGLAFTHTRSVLLTRPFRLGRFFKLALLAAFTQASFLSVSFSYPLQGGVAFSNHRHLPGQAFASDGMGTFAGALGLGFLLFALVLIVLLTLGYLYLTCRARATLFDLVLTRAGRVRDAWRRQARPARRYFGLFLLALLAFWTLMAATIGPVVVHFFKLAMAHSGTASIGLQAGPLMLVLAGLIWLLLPVWIAVDALLQDFILPGLALDQQAPVSAAFGRLAAVARRTLGQLLLFLVLRTVVPFGLALALGLVALVALGMLGLGAWGFGHLLYRLLWTGSLAAHALFFAVALGMGLLVLTLYLLCAVAIYGVTGTFKTSYAAYFYAGYYPELAARLYPPDDEELVSVSDPGSPPFLPPLKARADLPPELW